MNRTDARERAVHLLFETDTKDQPISLTLSELEVAPDKYTVELLRDYTLYEEKINRLIADNSKGWLTERLATMDRAILRMAITELVRGAVIPVGTIISEAVTLCETYSTPESPRFVNGVLSSVAHKVRAVGLIETQVNERGAES